MVRCALRSVPCFARFIRTRGRIGLLRCKSTVSAGGNDFLIYGANTDVGKTVVSAALCRYAAALGRPVTYIKPVQTGNDTDAAAVLRNATKGGSGEDVALKTETLFHYPSPESPASAAEKAGMIPPKDSEFRDALVQSLARARGRQPDGVCVIETAGGPLSPGPNHSFQADIYAPLALPCVLVGDPKLGGISATVCAYEALKARSQPPQLILFLGSSDFAGSNAVAVRRALKDGPPVLEVSRDLPPMEEPLTQWLAAPEVETAMAKVLKDEKQQDHDDEHQLLDQQHLWHPYTSMVKPNPVWPVASAHGCSLQLEDGRRLVDGMASWWCAIHGYNVPELNAAATKQLAKMSHVMFGGLTHRPATRLAKLLVDNAPPGLTQVFLCDSGSVSVEVALKMSLQYWAMKGRSAKTRIATVQRGYHGDTFGAMSVCDPVRGMHSLFQGALAQQLFAEPPALCTDWSNPPEEDGFSSMEELLRKHHSTVAAVIIEPMVQGAGGMRIYHPDYLRKLRRLCDELDVLLIFDEIATGFGRTGKLFAAEWAEVVPDIMCIGKALTGGYCTLGATLATKRVGHGVSGADGTQPLMHGPTFMGNPLACSIAAASIELLLEGPWQKRVKAIEEQLQRELSPLAAHPQVKDVRALGAIGVVELHAPPKEPQKLQAALVEQGVWLRPFGQTIYTMPPFVISAEELGQISSSITKVLGSSIELAEM